MKCPNCNKIIKKKDTVCRFCQKEINNNEPINEPIKTRIIYQVIEAPSTKWLVLTLGILSFITLIETSFGIWYFFFKEKNDTHDAPYIKVLKTPIKKFEIDTPFEFDDLEITIKKEYYITKLENKYSIYNGKDVIVIPVSIKNNYEKNHSLNLFYYTIYGPNNNEIDEVAGYFDEALYYEEDLKPNEYHIKYLYILYDKDGTYTIKFKKNNQQIIVKYEIIKDLNIETIE